MIMINKSQVNVVLAALGFSFILIFSTALMESGVSVFEQLFFRVSLGLFIVFVILLLRRDSKFIYMKDFSFFVTIGLIFSLFTLSGLSPMALGTPIAVAAALFYTQPIFTAILSHVTGRAKVTTRMLGVVLTGVLGAFLLTNLRIANLRINLGILSSVLCGFFYAIYLWLKRKADTMQNYTPYQALFNTFLFAIPFMILGWFIFRNLSTEPLFTGIMIPNIQQLLLLVGFAIISTTLPYTLLNNVKVEEISPTSEGLILLGDLPLQTLWAILFFGQLVTITQFLGAALVLASAGLSMKLSSGTA